MNIDVLKVELTNDPLTRGYAAMTDVEAAERLNVVDRTTNKLSMTGSEVLNAMVLSELKALSADDRADVWNVCHLGTIDPFGIEAQIIQSIPGLTASIAALIIARKNNVSRAAEIGFGFVYPGHVQNARM